MNQFGNYVKEAFKPKPSRRKKEELHKALIDKSCPMARYDAHLPIEGMVINEKNYPISPRYLKNKNEAHL